MRAFWKWCRKYPLRSVPFLAMFGGLAIAIWLIDPINIPLIIAYLVLSGFFGYIIWKDSGGVL